MDIVDYIKAHTRLLKKEEIKELLRTQSLNFFPTQKPYLLKRLYLGPQIVFADLRSTETSNLCSLECYKGITYLKIYAYNFDPFDEKNELLKIHNNYFLAKWRYLYDKYQIPNEIIQKYEIKTGERCYLCHKRFLPEDITIPHHISYTFGRTIKVHRSCHGKIHSSKGKFRSLKPKTPVGEGEFLLKAKSFGDSIKYLKKDEWQQLKASIDNYRDKLIVTLLYRSGMRVGEFTKVEVEDIDFPERFIRIPPENSKTGEGRTVFVCWEILNDLKGYLKLNKLKKGKLFDLSTRRIQQLLKKYSTRAGVKATPHTLRHSHITHALLDKVPIVAVQKQVGHKRLTTTQIYSDLAPEQVRAAYENRGSD